MKEHADKEQQIAPEPFSTDAKIQPADFTPVDPRVERRRLAVRLGSVGSIFVFLLAGFAAWYVLTARSVLIETDPVAADVSIGTPLKIKLAGHYLLRSGNYGLTIRHPGYYPLQEQLRIGTEQNQSFSFSLQKLPGHLRVVTEPVAGAEIQIDEMERGTTPATIRDLAPGEHHLRVILPRYLVHEQQLIIEGKDIEQSLEIRLTPAWANVSIESEPAGANLLVDGDIAGRTPLTTEILHGTHRLELRLSGHKSWAGEMEFEPDTSLTLPTVVLQPADAILHLNTRPAGANVTANGEFIGRTPVELALIPGRKNTIRVFKQGYLRKSRTVQLKSGERRKLTLALQAQVTPVTIAAEPADAELIIDGVSHGRAAQKLQLPTRPHRIQIKKPGYVDYEVTITPRLGIDQQIRVRLKTLEQARLESIKPQITTAAGQIMKLFRPNKAFTMGASRREPGRRANESLRKVRLQRPFYLSVNEVSNAQYKMYEPTHSSGIVQNQTLNSPKQPVVKVSWQQAALYCNWLSERDGLPPFYAVQAGKIAGSNAASIGYRLVSEAEWAWAARAESNGRMLKFPWGERLPPATRSGNFADRSAAGLVGRIVQGYKDGFATTAPVGSFAANSKGLFDLGGNAAEWVHDFYDIAVGENNQPVTDPLGPPNGEHHVIRGSSWAHGSLTELRLSYRDYGVEGRDDVGFRIARYLE